MNPALQLFEKGRQLERLGKPGEAAACYRQAIALAPDFAEAHTMYAQILIAMREHEKAKAPLERALAIKPELIPALLLRAKISADESKSEDAIEDIQRALAVQPTHPMALGMLGARLQELGRFDEAAEVFTRLATVDPDQAHPYFGIVRGRKVVEADRPMLAKMEALLKKSSQNPEERSLLEYALGKGYHDLGEFSRAIAHYDEANRISEQFLRRASGPFSGKQYKAHFDSLVKTFDRTFMERNAGVAMATDTPVFIVGMIRSGTTLTEQIVSSHPEVGAGGELIFWLQKGRDVIHEAIGGRFDPDKARRLGEEYLGLLEGLAPGKKRITDKLPNNFEALGLIHLLFPKARVIWCNRNPVDNCLSIYFTPFMRNSPEYAHNRENIVTAYRQQQRLLEHWKTVLPPGEILEVRYEEVVENRERVARQMISFLGLEWDDACLHHEKNERTVTTPSVWQVRQPVYRSAVDRWRNYEPWLGAFSELI